MLSAGVVILLTFLLSAEFDFCLAIHSTIPTHIALQSRQSWRACGGAALLAKSERLQMHLPVHAPFLHQSHGRREPAHSCDRAPRPGEPNTCRGTSRHEYPKTCWH